MFNNMNKKEIILWAKENGFKAPSVLNKQKLSEYVEGQYKEKQAGLKKSGMQKIPIDNIKPKYCDKNINWLEHLHLHGWTTVKIKNWDPNYVDEFFKFLESCNENFDKNDPTTWCKENLPDRIMSRGVIKNYFGHNEFLWNIRELCVPIFSEIWQTDDLLCSFDGGCFLAPTTISDSYRGWFHHDTPRGLSKFCCVQGIVNFVDNGVDDGGLVLLERSQDVHKEYMEKYPSTGIIWEKANIKDTLLEDKKMIKICASGGNIILFDSRIFHCNIPPTGKNYRMCSYVSMLPRYGASDTDLNRRIAAYNKGKMTGHWCYGPGYYENPIHPQFKDSNIPKIIEIAKLNDIRQKLIGYTL
jgi:hypothetical protein